MNWGSVMASSVSRNMRFLNSRMACPSRPAWDLLFLCSSVMPCQLTVQDVCRAAWQPWLSAWHQQGRLQPCTQQGSRHLLAAHDLPPSMLLHTDHTAHCLSAGCWLADKVPAASGGLT